ncbi:MAG TPA: tetratricopeptide repeat protein [Puia sp.]|nr:tetratricopeptide repeat protein [Puia sp.]
MRILTKKLTFAICLLFVMGGLRSQSTVEAYRLLYYQRYEGAAHLLQPIIKADPNNAEAWWLLTRAYLHNGKTDLIRDSLRLLPAGNANAPLILCAYGQVLLQDHKKDSAMLCFNKAMEETKQKDPKVLLAIAIAQQDAPDGDAAYAIDMLNRALKKDKRNPELYVAMGNAYRKLANGTESYKAYQDALNQDSRYAEAAYRLGKIFVSQGNDAMYVKYFNDAVAADSLYAPAWYELYYHYYFKDVDKAMDCLRHYIAASDKSSANDYLMTDLLYASRKYQDAIQHAQLILGQQGQQAEPRLFKLIAYSYKELNDSARALEYMRAYFGRQQDTGFVVKDYETMGDIYDQLQQPDSAATYYVRAEAMEKDTTKNIAYAKKLAGLYKKLKDYPNQAIWLGKYYQHNAQSTNLDLFNWGLANYMAKDYPMADSVFGLYETKYPDQDFGYYWRARSDAAIDTSMTTGIAIPHYLKLIDIAVKDTTSKTNRKHLVESYGYIAAYKANAEKDYAGAIDYFEKLLSLDPGNTDARRYITILKKNQEKAAKQTDKAEKTEKNETSKAGR